MSKNTLIQLIFVMFLAIYSAKSSACYYSPDKGAPQHSTTLNINMGSVTTQQDALGGVLAVVEGPMTQFGGAPASFSCGTEGTKGPTGATVKISGDDSATEEAIYPTNIPGIGVKLYYYSATEYAEELTTPTQTYTSYHVTLETPYWTSYQNPNAMIRVELVKTGTVSGVTGGSLTFKRTGFMKAESTSLIDLNITAKLTSNTCNVDSSTPTHIDLKKVGVNEFTHKGETSGNTPFVITLKCSGQTLVNMLLDGEEDTDAIGQGVLALNAQTNSAQGVGVQILYSSAPVEFGKNITVGNSDAGMFTIPMVARYYDTQSTPVHSGKVSASLIYSFTYQ